MDHRLPLGDETNITTSNSRRGRKRSRAEFGRPGGEEIENVDAAIAEHKRKERRDNYANLLEEEKERRRAKASENYHRNKAEGKTSTTPQHLTGTTYTAEGKTSTTPQHLTGTTYTELGQCHGHHSFQVPRLLSPGYHHVCLVEVLYF
ncbi:hypothetical protein SEVIR_1G219700v4 [Setaria viridis]|uniref:Uncharacterized protein n=1 Tax=Setaria viridis TaxID=4556 RepID=A0A4U6WC36_SETVI|nr:hypothetical protein SEVIR_1G219700v2 [Setaria viridis]